MTEQQDNLEAAVKSIAELRLLRWKPTYHGEINNPSAPGRRIDMWLLVDDQTGDRIVSLGVPGGRSDIAGYVAAACSNPVRWVTSMWRPDPRRDGLDDPEDVFGRQASEIGDVLFKAYAEWLDKNGGQSNGWTLNDALSHVWYAFCGQLSHDMRGRLLFKFMQLATTDGDALMESGLGPRPANDQSAAKPQRDLRTVMQEILKLVPDSDERKRELTSRVLSIDDSLDYAAPESIRQWWLQFANALEGLFPANDQPWIEQIQNVMANRKQDEALTEHEALRVEAERLLKALEAACGYLTNAKIDLQTGAPKATAIRTIDGGLKMVAEAMAKAHSNAVQP